MRLSVFFVLVALIVVLSSCFNIFNLGLQDSGTQTENGQQEMPTVYSDNVMYLEEESGVSVNTYPLQFARPFIQGEIPQFPQLVVNGKPVDTQADVKQRYSDGSVRHAIISAVIELPARTKLELRFQNQTGSGGVGPTVADLLANFDFDASMELNGGSAGKVSARTMLEQGYYQYWTKGPVCTTLLLADHSSSRTFDCGIDGFKSVRPSFQVSFWPTLKLYQIRYIAETSNTEAFQDQQYSLSLKAGLSNYITLYSNPAIHHIAGSRWTKQFWNDGREYPAVSLDHNLVYLSATRFIPNFDSSKYMSESLIASIYTEWQTRDKELYDAGWWTKTINAPGGRPDFGLYPTWTVRWLYSGDYRLAEITLKQGELCGAWPVHFREGNPAKYLDRTAKVPGLGHAVSISSRPSLWISHLHRTNDIRPDDMIAIVGSRTTDDWYAPDNEHYIDPASVQYLLTGDYWYLEEMYFFASFSAAAYTPDRGPTGAEGGLYYGAERAHGRALRTRCAK